MSERDFYDVLGVSRSATQDEIRKAYKKLAKTFHPDVKPDDPSAQARFAEITEAYEALGDEDKRRKYDQFGHSFRSAGGGGNPFQGFGGGAGGGASFDLDDILGGMFGGGRGGSPFGAGARRAAQRPQKGQDAHAEITVPFQVAVEGGNHELTLQSAGKTERLTVKIPAGVEDGKSIRLSGQGNPGGNGGAAGDLLITIRVAPHPWFRREGRNLLVDVPITVSEAALGAKVEVPTLTEGTVLMTVPPGTSSGAKLRLRGKGAPDTKSGVRGDQLAVLKIVVPKQLTTETRELFEKLAEATLTAPRDGLWGT